ncbi:MAG: Stf0 family sulfotransferase [Gaiellaceae bacterium]
MLVFGRVFSNPRFVWIGREDVVAQAVSWWKAIQTEQWWARSVSLSACHLAESRAGGRRMACLRQSCASRRPGGAVSSGLKRTNVRAARKLQGPAHPRDPAQIQRCARPVITRTARRWAERD